jgi:diguanylate cyclase (GGDEF)-like protein
MTARLPAPLAALRHWLPQGQLLEDHVWRHRHRTVVTLIWLHAAGLTAFALIQGLGVLHSAAEGGLLALAAVAASTEAVSLRVRSACASFGLIASSAVLVHLWSGAIEAHFHFFVMIAVLALYQDWVPFGLALAMVVLHHGLTGVFGAEHVYNHPDAIAHPWRWSLIHGGFVLAASAAHVVAWRANETQLLRDPLTGLPSRLMFTHRLESALERLDRHPGALAVLFLDLDRFKLVNDSLGHGCGDTLLTDTAQRLCSVVRRHELVARFGGDEFAILCEDLGDEQDALAVAERVLKALGQPFHLGRGPVFSTASIGIALATGPGRSADELLRDADAAMYRAKQSGGGRSALFDDVMRQRSLARLSLESDLRQALALGQLTVHYQPEVSMPGGLAGMEALVRWQHPERGLLAPGDFISLAEETGLIVPIGAWVLEESCRRAQAWRTSGLIGSDVLMRVNVSARQLSAGDELTAVVARVLESTGLDPAGLCLEVTESVLAEDAEGSIEVLRELKALGVQIAVDDFGTGYSSLRYLRQFPLDCVKIDRSFVRGLPSSGEDAAIVAAVIELGHSLGLSVTAEGVETEDQLAHLSAAGCDTAQGFLFSRPESAAAIVARLAEPGAFRRPALT